MITFTGVQLAHWVEPILWPLFRIAAFLTVAPIFGSTALPRLARLGLALLLTIIVAPFVHLAHPIALASWHAGAVACVQILVGLAMGFVMKAVVATFELSGTLIGMQSGLGFANVINPEYSPNVQPVLGNFLTIAASLAILISNAHLVMLKTLIGSLNTLPVGTALPALGHFGALARWFALIFKDGVLLALPVVGLLMGTHITLGVISKVAPALNNFAVGFAVLVCLAFVGLVWVMPEMPALTHHVFVAAIRAVTHAFVSAPAGGGHG